MKCKRCNRPIKENTYGDEAYCQGHNIPLNKLRYETIDQIKEANADAGQHFFDPKTMKFWSSKVGSDIFHGRFFITSERCGDETRRYTIREAKPNGHIETVGKFQQFDTPYEAMEYARCFLD